MSARTQDWILAGLWIFSIYATLPIARVVSDVLRQQDRLSDVITFLCLICGVILIKKVLENKTVFLRQKIFILCVMFITALTLWFLRIPEERIHIVQYGIFAWLLERALSRDWSRLQALVLAWFIAALAGFWDEILQGFLPKRYFSWGDVGLNTWGAWLAVLCKSAFKKKY